MSDAKPRLQAPAGTCDTHLHVYGPAEKYPVASTAPFPPPDLGTADYQKVMRRLGIARAVIVQPSAYGFDNTATLDGMAALGPDAARGIAVVPPDAPDRELERLTKAGMRGIRYFMLPGGVLGWDTLERMAARVLEHGWHVQLQLDGRQLPERIDLLRRLRGPLVIDHNGKFLEPVATDHPAFRALLALLDNGRTWVKLSAPYETSKAGPPGYDDVAALARALVAHAPERCLWATNWPHPSVKENKPDDAAMLDLLLDWAPDEATRRRILVDNPTQLYGF